MICPSWLSPSLAPPITQPAGSPARLLWLLMARFSLAQSTLPPREHVGKGWKETFVVVICCVCLTLDAVEARDNTSFLPMYI
jgi:hypothetical protein